jgi:hypothetical protein
MNLRLPASGLLLESLLGGLGTPGIEPGNTTVRHPTPDQLSAAIEAMAGGHMEYVILEEGGQFLQAAGDGNGPYALQYFAGAGEPIIEVPGGVDAETVRTVLAAYLRGEPAWRGALAWQPV